MNHVINVFFAYQFSSAHINKSDRELAITRAITQASKELQQVHPNYEIRHQECRLSPGLALGSQILDLLTKSQILVADISEGNPNVMFELGYLCGYQVRTERKALCIAHESVDLRAVPSDIRGLFVEQYTNASIEALLCKLVREAAIEVAVAEEQSLDTTAIRAFWGWSPASTIDIVCSEIPRDDQPYFANPKDRNYLRYAKFADLDTLLYVRASIPTIIQDAQIRDFSPSEYFDSHCHSLVVIGGPPWNEVFRRYQSGLPFRFIPNELGQDDPLRIDMLNSRELRPTWAGSEGLRCDVSVVSRLFVNDVRVVLLAGCLTWGVLGAAKAFLDGRRAVQNINFIHSLAAENDVVVIFESEQVGHQIKTTALSVQRPLIVLGRESADKEFHVLLDRS